MRLRSGGPLFFMGAENRNSDLPRRASGRQRSVYPCGFDAEALSCEGEAVHLFWDKLTQNRKPS